MKSNYRNLRRIGGILVASGAITVATAVAAFAANGVRAFQ